MYSLEKRGTAGKIKTQYANLNTADNCMLQVGDPTDNNFQFFIPNNVFVIGTMNTIDRSVESFDFALRRRFVWEEVMPNIRMLKGYLGEKYPQWQELAAQVKMMLTVELNSGQMVEDVRLGVNGKVPVEFYGRMGGMMPTPEEIVHYLETLIQYHHAN